MDYKDYYKTLGVDRKATQDEIKRSYRKLARKYHPDVSKETDAELKFKDLGEAYEVLKDPEKRVAYDQLGSNWNAQQGSRPPPGWDAGFEFQGAPRGGAGQHDFSDFLNHYSGRKEAQVVETGGFICKVKTITPKYSSTLKIVIMARPAQSHCKCRK